jgi:hypothetical protein
MNNLFDKWKTRVPRFSEEFRSTLFDPLTKKLGGSEKTRINLGKHFSNNYELYIYAFFLGLYNNEHHPIEEKVKKVDFGHPIQYWGSKGGRLERKDFTVLQEYIFAALIARTDLDLIALEKGELSDEDAVRALILTMEAFTHGGLTLIKEKYDENSNLFLQPTAFLKLILDSKTVEALKVEQKAETVFFEEQEN